MPFLLAIAIALAGCERKAVPAPSTPQHLQAESSEKPKALASRQLASAVDAYALAQNPENDAAVRKAMADVDAELAEMEDLLAKRYGREREKIGVKLRLLEAYRSEQTTRFAEAQAGGGLTTPEPRANGAGAAPSLGTVPSAADL